MFKQGHHDHANLPEEIVEMQRDADPIRSEIWSKLHKADIISGDAEFKTQFTPEILAMEEKRIKIKGYMYPKEAGKLHHRFYLSSMPLVSCYFCGKEGPQTVIEVSSREAVPYSPEPITVEGTFVIKEDDPNFILYKLHNARAL